MVAAALSGLNFVLSKVHFKPAKGLCTK